MKNKLLLFFNKLSGYGLSIDENLPASKTKRYTSGIPTLMAGGLIAGLTLCPTISVAQHKLPQQQTTMEKREMEKLNRGLIAVNQGNGKVYIGWRLLNTDNSNTAFNLFRRTGDGEAVKLNAQPITSSTNWVDEGVDLTQANAYFVRPVQNGSVGNGEEQAVAGKEAYILPANAPAKQYFSIPLDRPAGGVTPDGVTYTYSPNDASVADLDGDGEYEIVLKWDPSNSKDNSQGGFTGNVFLDAYKMDGTKLWRIDLGRNIRAGAHYTQFMVFDLDGDGKAEVACKTADATIDGAGTVIGDLNADWRNPWGWILAGPEYLTVFNGETGAAMSTVDYVPSRHPTIANPTPAQIRTIWGDDYGNRLDRFLAGVAYLDGKSPSLIMSRGYYTRAVVVAWDFKNGQLTRRWTFDSDDGTPGNSAYRGQGNHSLSIGDVDGDGKDEIIFGAAAIDDDGKGLYSTGLGHGDALHLSDMDPTRPGLEVFQPHEDQRSYGPNALEMRDAASGKLIWGNPGPNQRDVGRGIAMDIDPRHLGFEAWGSRGLLYNVKGQVISSIKPNRMNFAVWWDGDLLRELLDGTIIDKWDYLNNRTNRLLTAYLEGAEQINGTKANPALSADLFGDWREEVIWRHNNNRELLVFTTTIPTSYRFTTLMQDPIYRLSVAWQNVGYNQPPHTGFYLGEGMTKEQLSAAGHYTGKTTGQSPSLQVYPNPSSGEFHIRIAGDFTFSILDKSGSEVEKGKGTDTTMAGAFLPAGIYMVKIETTDGSKIIRVVKE